MGGEEENWMRTRNAADRARQTSQASADGSELVIPALLYADDTALVAMSYMELCEMVSILDECLIEWGLSISIEKTKVMVFGDQGGEERAPLVLRGSVVEEVEEFKYLGS
eukprot:918-Eustigmatos_ZCMA.PRE.1